MKKLIHSYLKFVVYSFLGLFIFYGLLRTVWEIDFSARWLVLASAFMAYQSWVVWKALPQNHRKNEIDILPTFGPGNAMSLARSFLISVLGGFFFIPMPPSIWAWLPLVIYLLADITDYLDGYLARRADHVTVLGEALDMNNDSLGVLVVTLLAFQYGTLPWWYVPFGFARIIFLVGIWQRERRGLPVYDLIPSMGRRAFAGVQMGFLTAMLAPPLGPPGTWYAATIFMVLFAGRFIYDWLQVSGRVGPNKSSPGLKKIWHFLTGWFPVALRSALVWTGGIRLFSLMIDFSGQAQLYRSLGMTHPEVTLKIFAIFEGLYWVSILFGILGRTIAIAGLVTAGFKLQWDAFTSHYWILLIGYLGILFLGTGKYSLWKPEEWLIYNRAGEQKAED